MNRLTEEEVDRLIEMCWEDRTPFEAIKLQFGLTPNWVVAFMRAISKPSSFKMWRKCMSGRNTNHKLKRVEGITRFESSMQKQISLNKISKRWS